jgi:hypothetical protein
MLEMIAGSATVFNSKDDPEFDDDVLIEVTDWGNRPNVEVAFSFGKRRVYLRFRTSDLLREIKELNNV